MNWNPGWLPMQAPMHYVGPGPVTGMAGLLSNPCTGLFIRLQIILVCVIFSSCSYRFYSTGCETPVPGNLVKYSSLDSSLAETSGLLYMEGDIWTFNDSGGEAALYCFDQGNGSVIRKTIISNATNTDWEDIAMDDHYIYVADVGNNFATRDTLAIYRIQKSSVLSGNPTVDHNGIISLSFDEQVVRNRRGFSSHDCEALFAHGDSLYLFSKNWVDESTSVYVIPSIPGHYHVTRRYRYEARILVTGADLFPDKNQVAIVGYRNYLPIVIIYGYANDPGNIECGGLARIYPLRGGRQVEGICFDPEGGIFISSEASLQNQTLFKLGRSLR
ncbi:MAG: hypothetical protein ABFS38_13770 [Bacteroidota bacterium]